MGFQTRPHPPVLSCTCVRRSACDISSSIASSTFPIAVFLRSRSIADKLTRAISPQEGGRDHQQRTNHIHRAPDRILQRTRSGPTQRLWLHKLGADLRNRSIIARKQHLTGRGLPDTTTSPSSPRNNLVGDPLIDVAVQLPPPPSTILPFTTTQNALFNATAGTADHSLPVPLSLDANGPNDHAPATVDISGALAASSILQPMIDLPMRVAASAPHPSSDASSATMMDAHSIQAQVEALIKSTSDSAVANDDSSQQPLIPSLPLAPVLPMSTTGVLSGPTGVAGQASVANVVAEGIVPQPPPGLAQQPPTADSASASTTSNSVSADPPSVAAGPSFQNTFAQYQFSQNLDRGSKGAVQATSTEAVGLQGLCSSPGAGESMASSPSAEVKSMSKQEEKRAADELIGDLGAQGSADANVPVSRPEPFSGADLAAAAQAIGLEADVELLDGISEDQRALAAAIKRLGAEHTEAAQKAIQQAAAAAAEAAAARASEELAKAAAKGQGYATGSLAATHGFVGPLTSASASPSASRSRSGSGPVKRFPCPKCDKAFARAYNLNTHLSTHDPDPNRSKPFACPYPSCKSEGGRSFSRKHDLQRHVASIHENEAEPGIHGDPEEVVGGDTGGLVSLGLGTPGKKFRCEHCGRSFVRRDACNRHQCDSKDSPSSGTSMSPSSTPYQSSVSPNSSHSQRLVNGHPVALPAVRPAGPTYTLNAAAGSMSKGSPSPAASASAAKHAGDRSSSSLSKEVQAVAKQLQARVEAQSPGSQHLGPPQRNAAPLAGGERRSFPLSAISLYASTGTTGMHSSSSSSPGGSKAQIAK